jgi:NADP+-dependent farnesol dehydrogenase
LGFQELAEFLKSAPGKLYALKCDITKEAEVQEAFKWIKTNLGGVDILINNAGVASNSKLIGS